jgi:hypothetical protein
VRGRGEQTQALRKFPSCPCVFKSERRTEGAGTETARVGRGNNRAADPPPLKSATRLARQTQRLTRNLFAACRRS